MLRSTRIRYDDDSVESQSARIRQVRRFRGRMNVSLVAHLSRFVLSLPLEKPVEVLSRLQKLERIDEVADTSRSKERGLH